MELNKEYIELINKEIDHLITPNEKIKLDNYLVNNSDAKEYYNELILTNAYLSKLPDNEPTENLKKQIINSIDFSRYSTISSKHSFWSVLFAPKFGVAYTLALGLVLGLIIYAVMTNNANTININDVYGTIGMNNEGAKTIAELPLKFSDISGEIEIKGKNKNFWFNLDLNSKQEFDIIITYPDNVKFENLRLGLAHNVKVSKGQNFIKTTNFGSQQYSLLFLLNNPEPSTLHIQIQQSGINIYDGNLSLKY